MFGPFETLLTKLPPKLIQSGTCQFSDQMVIVRDPIHHTVPQGHLGFFNCPKHSDHVKKLYDL